MLKNISAILIWSQDYRKLANWYKEKLGLQILEELNHPEDTGVGFRVGRMYLWIGQHSKVKGKNKDIHRHMFDFTVDSVTKTYKELKKEAFYDLDNNLVQLIGDK